MRRLALWLALSVAPLACAQGQAVDDGGHGSGGSGATGGTGGGFSGSGGSGGGGNPDARPRPDASAQMDAPPIMVDAPPVMQIDAPAPAPDAPPPQGPCGTVPVIPVTIPYNVTMTTTGGTDQFHVTGSANDLITNCLDGDGTGSPDKVFQLTLATTSNVTVSVDNGGTNFQVVLYVRSADCRSYEGCQGQFVGSDPRPLLIGTNVAAGTYFIIVDGFNASGTFQLTVTSP